MLIFGSHIPVCSKDRHAWWAAKKEYFKRGLSMNGHYWCDRCCRLEYDGRCDNNPPALGREARSFQRLGDILQVIANFFQRRANRMYIQRTEAQARHLIDSGRGMHKTERAV